jgi:hypothetical protein
MIIFLHGAIPHNHQQEHQGDCKSVYHCCHDGEHNPAQHNETDQVIDESGAVGYHHFVCHFSTGPFHSLDNDTPFISGSQLTFRSITGETAAFHTTYSAPDLRVRQESPENRRGPPPFMG